MTAKHKNTEKNGTSLKTESGKALGAQRHLFMKLSEALGRKRRMGVLVKRCLSIALSALAATAILPVILINCGRKKSFRPLAVLTAISATVLLFSTGAFFYGLKVQAGLSRDIAWLEGEIEYLED